jgi:hypothetical protein
MYAAQPLLDRRHMCHEAANYTFRPLCDIARDDLRRVLELVQVDQPGAARAVALKLRCLADDALLAGHAAIRSEALCAASAADRWHVGIGADEARVDVLRTVIAIARQLRLTLF